ncbi:fido domain-containing protein [Scleroderma citrinum]
MKDKPELLTTENLKAVHTKLMRTLKVQIIDKNSGANARGNGNSTLYYVNAGCTRQTTQKTAVVRSNQYNLAFCPVERVDQQLDYICKMGRQYIARWRNPFATAAWLHVTFTRCHPFDDGNGRMARLISSIPLLRFGFPPLCITPTGRRVYYDSMNVAWDGDYQPMINCFVNCIRDAMTDVERIMS